MYKWLIDLGMGGGRLPAVVVGCLLGALIGAGLVDADRVCAVVAAPPALSSK